MKNSESAFDYIQSLHYKRHNISPNLGESYIDSPDWMKNKQQQ